MPSIPSPRNNKRARIEIIPLIDIMFFLLATFMMVSLSMIKNDGLDLNLPAAKSSTKMEDNKKRVTLSISKENGIFYNKEPVSLEELKARLTRIKEVAPEMKLIIQSDRNVEFGEVIQVLDEARNRGLNKFVIRTKKAENALEE